MRKPIEGYEGWYEIDEQGTVYSVCRKQEIVRRPYTLTSKKGCDYKRIRLQKNGTSKHKLIHRLVAETFIPNPDNLPQVNHKDEDTFNNSVDNLEWVTCQDNVDYSQAIPRLWKTPNGEYVRASISRLSKVAGLSLGNLSELVNGNRKQHKGWTFIEPA